MYRRLIAAQPRHYHALHFLGVLRAQLGDMAGSADLVRRALAIKPDDALAQYHLAETLALLAQHGDAAAHYARAAALDPAFVPARIGLVRSLIAAHRAGEALDACDKALAAHPAIAELQACRGEALIAVARDDEALQAFNRAIVLTPGLLAAELGRARCFIESGHLKEALAAYDAAASSNSAAAEPLTGRANVLKELGRFDEAYAAYQQSLARDPANAGTYYGMGCTFLEEGRTEAAIAAFDSALALQPGMVEALYNRAYACDRLGRLDEALADCEKALAIDPNAGLAATKSFLIRARRCDWSHRSEALAALERLSRAGTWLDSFALLTAFDDPAMHLAAARLRAPAPLAPFPIPQRGSRLRVAYLSPNFHDHPVAHHTVSVFETHDCARFEIFGICLAPGEETPIRARLRAAFDHFIEAGSLSDLQLASLLHDRSIDIAVDLAGYTEGGRTGALRYHPAAVSVNWLGYAGTTGAPYMDYILADKVLIPPGDEAYYSEKIVRLPTGYMPRDAAALRDPAPSRAELCLPDSGFVFCAFNNTYKITPQLFGIWMNLLHSVEGSVLWLNIQGDLARGHLRREAEARGIAPGRLIFAQRTAGRREHLARLAAADLFLDTMPYGAHSTANDMLWRGVPVLTCRGRSFASRVAASMLTVMGVPELITDDLEAYRGLALELARDPERLSALRRKVGEGARLSPLFDSGRFCRALEEAYRTMAERAFQGQKPAGFSVIMPG